MDFSRMFETWINVTTRPGEATFEAELNKPQANLVTALIWIVIAAVVLAILSAIGAAIAGLLGTGSSMMQMMLNQANLPPEVKAQLAASTAGAGAGIAGSFCWALILAPIGFIISSLIYFVVAKIFGGVGTFEQNTYILATFTAPLIIISGALGVIPFLGGCLSLFVTLYQIYLTYLAMKVTHRLSNGAAWVVALTPVILGLLCVCFMFIVGFSIIAALVGAGSMQQ
jgi:hypothetical protein